MVATQEDNPCMTERQVRVIAVPKRVSFGLLVLVTVVMAALVYLLSGNAYAAETHPIREMLSRILVSRRGPVSRSALLSFLMPVVANILLFVPWGFLTFVWLDGPGRPRRNSYALTVMAALLFAAAMVVWQQFLPTRVTSVLDALANGVGALAGAALGHARKGIYVRFEE